MDVSTYIAGDKASSIPMLAAQLDTRALSALHALSQQTRLSIFRLLIAYEPTGLSVGEIAQAFHSPPNTISTHLAILARAKLAVSNKSGRSVNYRADLGGMQWLIEYLLADCCKADGSMCGQIFSDIRQSVCSDVSTKGVTHESLVSESQ